MIPIWSWLALAAVALSSIAWLAWACARMSGMAQRVEYGERGR